MSLDLKVGFPSLPHVFNEFPKGLPYSYDCNSITQYSCIASHIIAHTYRAQKLINVIALGILGMIPFTKYSILNRKIPSITWIRSTPSLFKTELVLGIAVSIISFCIGLKYFIEQKASIEKINAEIQIFKKFITEKTKTDFQNVFYEQGSNFFILKNDVLTNNEQIAHVLSSVLKNPNDFLKYPAQVVEKCTLSEPSLSIFTIGISSLITREIYGNDCKDRNQTLLAWVDLLTNLVKSNAKLPDGTLECLIALSVPYFEDVNTHTFGINPETAIETQDSPNVKYEIQINESKARILNVSYKKEGSICFASLNTPDELASFLKMI